VKLLLDQNLSFRFIDRLSAYFPGSTQTRVAGLDRATDLQIWDYAKQHYFTVVTKDMDFYELALARGIPPKVVWLRCGNVSNRYLLALLLKEADTIAAFIEDSKSICLELA
jgi:predicted nuclease of predicted toxin-antitoxin system